MLGSNDLENYIINYEIYDSLYPDFDIWNYLDLYQSFDLKIFYIQDSLFYFFISVLKLTLNTSIADTYVVFAILCSYMMLVIFSTLPLKKFLITTIFYLINFLYLFNINQLRESLIVVVVSYIIIQRKSLEISNVKILLLSFLHKSSFIFFFYNFRLFRYIIPFLLSLFLFSKISINEIKWLTDFDQRSNVFGLNSFLYICLVGYFFLNKGNLKNTPLYNNLQFLIPIIFILFLYLSDRIPTIGIRLAELGIYLGFFFIN